MAIKNCLGYLVVYTTSGKKCRAFAKETLTWSTMKYKTKTISRAYCSSSSFEHIFPAILKTVIQTKASVANS